MHGRDVESFRNGKLSKQQPLYRKACFQGIAHACMRILMRMRKIRG